MRVTWQERIELPVVLTFIALFDDILAKLGELAKVNKKAKAIFDAATQKRADQDVFETYLIDQLKSNSLLTALDAEFLNTLRTLRNKAAHPSGHHASAEEARFVFFEAVSRFLGKPILTTTQLADEVLASLSNSNLFPTTNVNVIAKVVNKELANIHPQVYPYLIAKLLEKTQLADVSVAANARFFLTGLARAGDMEALAALRRHAIEKKAPDKAYVQEIITLISANSQLFIDLDEVTYQRIAVLVGENVKKVDVTLEHTKLSHPAYLFASLFSAIESTFVLQKLSAQFDAFLERFTYSAYFASKVLDHPVPRALLLDKLCKRAGSSDFTTANAFAAHADDIEKVMAGALLPAEAFKLLVNVIRAAEIGAFSAIDMKNAHFGATPKLRAKATEYLMGDVQTATAMAKEILGLPEDQVDDLLSVLAPVEDA